MKHARLRCENHPFATRKKTFYHVKAVFSCYDPAINFYNILAVRHFRFTLKIRPECRKSSSLRNDAVHEALTVECRLYAKPTKRTFHPTARVLPERLQAVRGIRRYGQL